APALLLRFRTRDAVEAGKVRIRDADVAVGADNRPTDRAALAVDEGIELLALRRVVIVGGSLEGVGVHDDVAGAGRPLERAVASVIGRGDAPLDLGADAAAWDELRNAVVGGVHHTADRLAAVAQRRRPAHHLHLLGGEWIDGDGVVLGQVRHV